MMKQSMATAATLLAAGCSANPSMIRITDAPPIGVPFDGVPMRLKTEQTVQLWRLNPETDAYEKVSETRQILADQERLYAVDIVSGPFASPTLHITQYPDNTPKLVQAASSQNASGAIDVATSTVTGVSGLGNAATAARNADYVTCQNARAAATVQEQAVATARAAYDALPATASAELKNAYEQIWTKAREAAQFARNNPQC